MPFDPSATRARLAQFRERYADDRKTLDEKTATELSLSLVALRQERGAATVEGLKECGFVQDELDRLSARATESAARRWHGDNLVEAAA